MTSSSTIQYAVPPPEEERLRTVCTQGDLRGTFKLLSPVDSCFASPVGKMISKHVPCEQKIPSLDYIYNDDNQNRVVLYLAGAKRPLKGMDMLLQWVDRFFFHRSDQAKHDMERAQLLSALMEAGFELDFSVHNSKYTAPAMQRGRMGCVCRRQGVIYFCVNTNSVHVLRVVLRAASSRGFPNEKRPDLTLEDHQNRSPMRHALQARRFECIQLLVAAGALQGLLQSFHQYLSQAATATAPGPSVQPTLFESLLHSVTDPLKRKEQKMKAFENELMMADVFDKRINTKVLESQEAVWAVLFSAIETLIKHTALDPSSAVTVLSDHSFSLQSALEAVSDTPVTSGTVRAAAGGEMECIVCLETVANPEALHIQMPCGHCTCDACWEGILNARLSEGDVHGSICPSPDCSFCFPLTELSSVLPPVQVAQFMKIFSSRYVAANANLQQCPRQDCGHVLSLPDHTSVDPNCPMTAQCSCGLSFCWGCLKESHEPALCHQAAEWRSALDVIQTEKKSADWVESYTIPCPRCHSPIERNGGCNHMSCSVCRQQFCYQCGKKWKGHLDHYTCFANRPPDNERVETAVRLWSVLETIFTKFKQATTAASYEWHLRQYLAHDLDVAHLTSVANYMTNLLRATLPNEELYNREGEYRRVQVDTGYVPNMLQVLISSKRILKNSYILAFNLRKGSSRRKFLTKLQEQLENSIAKLMALFTMIPGFREIPRDVVVCAHSSNFTSNDLDFENQFLYCHALHSRRMQVDVTCTVVARMRDDICRASRLGLVRHTKPYDQRIPSSASPRNAQDPGDRTCDLSRVVT